MTRSRLSISACALMLPALSLLAGCVPGSSGTAVVSTTLRSALATPAQGEVTALLTPWVQAVLVKASGLAPDTAYALTADGVPVATLSSDAEGNVDETLLVSDLGVDPRDTEFGVEDGDDGDDVLAPDDENDDGHADSSRDERNKLTPTELAQGGRASTHLEVGKNGKQEFKVEIAKVPPGTYDVFVDGIQVGSIDATSGRGKLEFASAPHGDELPLSFDPAGAMVEIRLADALVFSGTSSAQVPGLDVCEPSKGEQVLEPASTGEAVAKFETKKDCDKEFKVKIRGVEAGDYELVVDAVVRGTIAVTDDGTGQTSGGIRFSSEADAGKLPLDFDPVGAPIEVRLADAVVFSIPAFEPVAAPSDGDDCNDSDDDDSDDDGDPDAADGAEDDCVPASNA